MKLLPGVRDRQPRHVVVGLEHQPPVLSGATRSATARLVSAEADRLHDAGLRQDRPAGAAAPCYTAAAAAAVAARSAGAAAATASTADPRPLPPSCRRLWRCPVLRRQRPRCPQSARRRFQADRIPRQHPGCKPAARTACPSLANAARDRQACPQLQPPVAVIMIAPPPGSAYAPAPPRPPAPPAPPAPPIHPHRPDSADSVALQWYRPPPPPPPPRPDPPAPPPGTGTAGTTTAAPFPEIKAK